MTACIWNLYRKGRVRQPPTDNIPSPQNYFQTNCRSVIPMHKKHLEHMDNLFECNLRTWEVFAHWVN